MKRALLASFAVIWLALVAGCNPQESDESQIRTLLGSSAYTDDDQTRAYGADDSTPTDGGGESLTDDNGVIPFVRFRRYIPPGGVSRVVNVQIPAYPGYPDTTALATVTADVYGDFRTAFDTTTNPIQVWRKPFHDQAVRKVYLTRTGDGWRIRKVSPLEVTTVDAAYELRLAELTVHASSWPEADTFRLTTADTLLAKSELPSFLPQDQVNVRITVHSTGDSCWTFLHHGRPRWPYRWRRAYFKTGTWTFERTWHIAPEGYVKAEVRPSGHDAIGWNTLFTDTTGPYVAAAWGFPYIVRHPSEQIPEE